VFDEGNRIDFNVKHLMGRLEEEVMEDQAACGSTMLIWDLNWAESGYDEVTFYTGCAHCEVVGLYKRFCQETPKPSEAQVEGDEHVGHWARGADIFFNSLRPQIGNYDEECSIDDYIEGHEKRNLYRQVWDQVGVTGQSDRTADVKGFIKAECVFQEHTVRKKKPRIIQGQDPIFNIEFGAAISKYQHALFATDDPNGNRWCAKGRNQIERTEDIKRLSEGFLRPTYIMVDQSGFERHVAAETLRSAEGRYSELMEPSMRGRVRKLHAKRRNARYWTKNGIRYRLLDRKGRKEKLDSGTGDTALMGVCVCVPMAIGAVNGEWGQDYALYDDGDDLILVTEFSYLGELMRDWEQRQLECGFECRVDGITRTLEDIEFCRSSMQRIWDSDVHKFCRTEPRALPLSCVLKNSSLNEIKVAKFYMELMKMWVNYYWGVVEYLNFYLKLYRTAAATYRVMYRRSSKSKKRKIRRWRSVFDWEMQRKLDFVSDDPEAIDCCKFVRMENEEFAGSHKVCVVADIYNKESERSHWYIAFKAEPPHFERDGYNEVILGF
jgi:hypothetical protein